MCERCDGFKQRQRVNGAYEYLDLIRQLRVLIDDGIFKIICGTCKLDAINGNEPWPADSIEHIFVCSHCVQKFKLYVNTYLGSGGAWETFS